MSHTKFGSDLFSHFDVYWIQANKQTYKHPHKPNLYMSSFCNCHFKLYDVYLYLTNIDCANNFRVRSFREPQTFLFFKISSDFIWEFRVFIAIMSSLPTLERKNRVSNLNYTTLQQWLTKLILIFPGIHVVCLNIQITQIVQKMF